MMLKDRGKQIIKQIVSPLADRVGVYDEKVQRLMGVPDRLLVLMYHRVIDDLASDPFQLGMCVRRRFFEEQLAWLATHAHVLPLTEAVHRLLNHEPLPPASVAITFDDGLLDNLENAAPLLEKYQLPATFYIITGELEEGAPMWWDRAIAILASTQATSVDPRTIGLPELPHTLSLARHVRAESCQSILNALWEHNRSTIHQCLARMEEVLKPGPIAPALQAPRMKVPQVKEMARRGFHIGAHTIHHIDPKLLNREQLLADLGSSRRELQDMVQQPVDSFAYPGGRSSVWMPDLLEALGFHHAVDTRRGINQAPASRFAIARVGMPDTPVGDFKRAIRNLKILDAAP